MTNSLESKNGHVAFHDLSDREKLFLFATFVSAVGFAVQFGPWCGLGAGAAIIAIGAALWRPIRGEK